MYATARVHTHAHTHAHMYTHIHTQTQTHAHTQTHMDMHARFLLPMPDLGTTFLCHNNSTRPLSSLSLGLHHSSLSLGLHHSFSLFYYQVREVASQPVAANQTFDVPYGYVFDPQSGCFHNPEVRWEWISSGRGMVIAIQGILRSQKWQRKSVQFEVRVSCRHPL